MRVVNHVRLDLTNILVTRLISKGFCIMAITLDCIVNLNKLAHMSNVANDRVGSSSTIGFNLSTLK
jgi:hypothetical protein